jgi:hypothetical protein
MEIKIHRTWRIHPLVKNIQRNLKVKSRELKKLLKEYDQIGLSNIEEDDKVDQQNLLGEEIARIGSRK